jgi:hypothetical protein
VVEDVVVENGKAWKLLGGELSLLQALLYILLCG